MFNSRCYRYGEGQLVIRYPSYSTLSLPALPEFHLIVLSCVERERRGKKKERKKERKKTILPPTLTPHKHAASNCSAFVFYSSGILLRQLEAEFLHFYWTFRAGLQSRLRLSNQTRPGEARNLLVAPCNSLEEAGCLLTLQSILQSTTAFSSPISLFAFA